MCACVAVKAIHTVKDQGCLENKQTTTSGCWTNKDYCHLLNALCCLLDTRTYSLIKVMALFAFFYFCQVDFQRYFEWVWMYFCLLSICITHTDFIAKKRKPSIKKTGTSNEKVLISIYLSILPSIWLSIVCATCLFVYNCLTFLLNLKNQQMIDINQINI